MLGHSGKEIFLKGLIMTIRLVKRQTVPQKDIKREVGRAGAAIPPFEAGRRMPGDGLTYIRHYLAVRAALQYDVAIMRLIEKKRK